MSQPMDIRDMGPTHVCICGSVMWRVNVIFHHYEIGVYMLDMECALCGTLAKAPTLADKPEDYVPLDDEEGIDGPEEEH